MGFRAMQEARNQTGPLTKKQLEDIYDRFDREKIDFLRQLASTSGEYIRGAARQLIDVEEALLIIAAMIDDAD